jgi:transcription initiation factor IIF auxiliary subunit
VIVPLRIAQDATYEGHDYWRWSVWLDASDSELDEVDHVVYTLHPSFPSPVRTVADRSTRFRLETGGWGTFMLYARVFKKNGGEENLEHDLKLYYPSDQSPAPA